MGGYAAVQNFYRLYLVPGMGHCFGAGAANGLAGVSPPNNPPMPAPDQLYQIVVAWVEKGQKPDKIVMSSRDDAIQRPVCPVPTKIRYKGGSPARASSFVCE
jgi:feruloyl esterase